MRRPKFYQKKVLLHIWQLASLEAQNWRPKARISNDYTAQFQKVSMILGGKMQVRA